MNETEKKGIKLTKLSSISKAEINEIKFDELWIMKPTPEMKMKPKLRYCGCRNVCLV